MKEQSAIVAFFEIIDTITENLVMGSIVTVLMGLGIVSVFTITKLYTQIISKTSSFRILENIVVEEAAQGNWKVFGRRLLHFEEEPDPEEVVPEHLSSILISLSLLYLVSWVYVLLFSEALFFVSWSAGVHCRWGELRRAGGGVLLALCQQGHPAGAGHIAGNGYVEVSGRPD